MRAWFIVLVAGGLALAGCATPNPDDKGKAALADPKQLLRLADASRESGDYAAAIRLYQKAIDQHGDGYEARMGLGSALAGAKNFDEAEEAFKTAGRMQPGRVEPNLAVGRLDLSRHRPAEALIALDAALILAPDIPAAWDDKGIALDMLERHEEAQQCYRNGLARAPNDRTILNNYGLSLALSGNYGESQKLLTELVQEPGATSRNRQNLALALGLQGDIADAKAVARTDLDEASVANNLRFYEAARQAPIPKQAAVLPVSPLPQAAAPDAPAASPTPAETPAAAPAAPVDPAGIAAAPLPAPTGDTVGGAAPVVQPVAQPVPAEAGPPVALSPLPQTPVPQTPPQQ